MPDDLTEIFEDRDRVGQQDIAASAGYLPTVKQMVEKYLSDGGFDGLYTDECGCKITDLFPCDNPGCIDCKPGYITATDCGDGTVDFGIGPRVAP